MRIAVTRRVGTAGTRKRAEMVMRAMTPALGREVGIRLQRRMIDLVR